MTDKTKLNLLMKSNSHCSICGEFIPVTDLDKVEVVKTRRNTVIVFHKECYKKKVR